MSIPDPFSIIYNVHSQGIVLRANWLWNLESTWFLSPRPPIFITLGQGVHENRQSYMDHQKNEILGESSLYRTWIEWFLLADGIISISMYYNSIFVISRDELNAKWDEFFWITHSQVVQVHPGINKSCWNVCLMLWVCVWLQFNGKTEL